MEDINTSLIKNILFVNSAVLSLSDYINSDTIGIGYDTHVSTIIPSAKNHNNVTRVGFAFHYSGEDNDHEAFFIDSDLGESVETFSPNVQSMLDLLIGGGITHADFLACGTLKSEKWRLFYQLLRLKTGVVIGASDDNTGNMKLGGDWIMESTHEEVGQIYFTSAIENWASLLALPTGLNQYYHTFYTINATTPAVITRTIYNNSGTMQDTQDISFGGMPIKDVFSLINGGTTNPYAIGIVDSSLNKICMDIAFCGVYTKPLTDRQKTKLMTYVNTTFKEPRTTVANTYTVTVTNNVYWISMNGSTSVNRPDLLLNYGKVYLFDAISNLPFYTNVGRSTSYVTGVVTNSNTGLNNYTLIDVAATAPSSLFYGSSATIGGNIYVSANTVLIRTSSSTVNVGGTVTVDFLSSSPPGTSILYTIGGTVTSANLNNANLLNNTFTSPSARVIYSVTGGGGNTMTFSSADAISVNVSINRTIASVTGILFDVKNVNGTFSDVVNTTTVTPVNSTSVNFASGVGGMYSYTVQNNLLTSATGITTFMVLKFTANMVMNTYFFQQSTSSNGTGQGGANLYTWLADSSRLRIGVNDYATTGGTGDAYVTDTPYIITLQHGKPTSTTLYELMRINGTTRAESSNTTSAGVPTFYKSGTAKSYFVFGSGSTVILAESIVYNNLLSSADISFVENTLATTYGITIA